ncbi:glycosyl transferase, partial [Pseudomonas syringae pv. tagetis]
AGLLKCPVNLIFCLNGAKGYRVIPEPIADAIEWRRSDRAEDIAHWATRYAERLGLYCLVARQQWIMFYPFLKSDDETSS